MIKIDISKRNDGKIDTSLMVDEKRMMLAISDDSSDDLKFQQMEWMVASLLARQEDRTLSITGINDEKPFPAMVNQVLWRVHGPEGRLLSDLIRSAQSTVINNTKAAPGVKESISEAFEAYRSQKDSIAEMRNEASDNDHITSDRTPPSRPQESGDPSDLSLRDMARNHMARIRKGMR